MRLFNASSMFNEASFREIMGIVSQPELLKTEIIKVKKALMAQYRFRALNLPEDFTRTSYVIAANHLTDSDAPLMMSLYYELMHAVKTSYPALFVFAKENCFNGVSIPKELMPVLDLEMVVPVDRSTVGGSMAAMKSAGKWYREGEKPQHFLIFAQGTIYDVNMEQAEDIESGAFWLARMLGIPVLPAFIEQAVEGEENRVVFGEPFEVPARCRDFSECKEIWLERVLKAQNALETLTGVPARPANLDEDHKTRKRHKTTAAGALV